MPQKSIEKINPQNRRQFLKISGLLACFIGMPEISFSSLSTAKRKSVKFGLVTDIHHGYASDAQYRLETFIHEAEKQKPDFIIQCGDFCHPDNDAKPFLNIWNSFKGDKFHVLGNHDMDLGTKEKIMDFWGLKNRYYSFDRGDFHFIVLDCNYILKDGEYLEYEKGNYFQYAKNRDYVSPEQIEWLTNDLEATDKQCIIFSHQSIGEIWGGYCVPNRHDVRKVIDDANNHPYFQKVIACFSGHHHVDDHSIINNVHYFQMNSTSYYYAGEGFGSEGAKSMYKDSLFAFVTIDPSGKIEIKGRQSQLISPTPKEKKHPDAARITAKISDRKVSFVNR
jgi:3',5'-cyclic AMP phosphodiesterase CpdA